MQDIFETPELLPDEIRDIIDRYPQDELTYEECAELKQEMECNGYTFDYYLDGIPFNLRKL